MRAFLSWLLCAVLLLGTTPVVAQQTNIQGGGSGGGCTVAGSSNQLVINNGSAGCSSSSATLTAGGLYASASPTANNYALALTSGSLTSGTTGFGLNLTGTVNDASAVDGIVTFANVTCTLCTATSYLVDYQVGSATRFRVDTAGNTSTLGTLSASALTLTTSGTESGPAVTLGNNTFFGFYRTGNGFGYSNNQTSTFYNGGTYAQVISTAGWAISSTTAASGTADTILTRRSAANWQLGAADAAAPVAQALSVQSVVTATSNIAGANWTLQGSKGTGTGVGGSIILQTAPASTTGSTPNTLVTAATIDGNSHVNLGGAAPAITLCGTGSPSVSGTDTSGTITVGTAAITCTLTFKVAYAAAPHCVISDQSLVANLTSYTVSTTAIVLTTVSNSGNLVNYVCVGL